MQMEPTANINFRLKECMQTETIANINFRLIYVATLVIKAKELYIHIIHPT